MRKGRFCSSYLFVDRREIPLVIDQPEGNLDNETVVSVLVEAIKQAKAYRQVIIVTHSPNLAVVGDADQFIQARMEDEHFVYLSGPLEELETNRGVVKVLEGTKDAFRNRGQKYQE